MNLQGKVAVVTGASGGIGSATAHRFAEAGCRVVVGYNSRQRRPTRLSQRLPGTGHRSARMPMEDTVALRHVAAMVDREYGRCDVLVNSAGFTRMIAHADLEALTDELIDAIFVANVRGPFATIRAFAPLMKQSDDAVIINISSGAAISGGGSNIAYGGSKAAIDAMTKSLARVLGPNIRVLSVSPGAVDTGFVPGRTTEMVETCGATHAAEARGSGRRSRATVEAAVTLDDSEHRQHPAGGRRVAAVGGLLPSYQPARQFAGRLAVAPCHATRNDRRIVAVHLLHQPFPACRQVMHHVWLFAAEPIPVDHVDIGLLANGQHTTIVQAGRMRGVRRNAADQFRNLPALASCGPNASAARSGSRRPE